VVLLRALGGVDLANTLRALSRSGPWALVALAPFLVSTAFDAAGMTLLMRAMARAVPFGRMLAIRIATEALHVTVPAGFLVSDSTTAVLLQARSGVPLREGAVLAVARKWLVMRAHGIYIALGAACGWGALSAMSRSHLGGPWLAWAVAGGALVPLGLSLGVGAGFRGGAAAVARAQSAIGSIPWEALRRAVAGWRAGAVEVDGHMASVGAARTVTRTATLAFFACWLGESLDTAIILRLVGAPFDFALAMGAEVGISLLRSVGNFAPAGLGLQDAGYATMLSGLGIPVDTAAAFVIFKRAKEMAWIAFGYALLASLRSPAGSLVPAWVHRVRRGGLRAIASRSYAFAASGASKP
jgi:glycosyltransferase 2 family protein